MTTSAVTPLPASVQAELSAVVRVLLGMDAEEKRNARLLFTEVAAFWAEYGRAIDHPAKALAAAVADLVTAAEAEATPTKEIPHGSA